MRCNISNKDLFIVHQEKFSSNGIPYPVASPYPGPQKIEPTAEVISNQSSLCVFDEKNFSQDSEEVAVNDTDYKLSNSRVFLAADFVLENIQWVPSGKQLLISYTTLDRVGRETIAIVDVSSASILIKGDRQFNYAAPIWFDNQQSIAYTDPIEGGNYNIFITHSLEENTPVVIAQTSQPNFSKGPEESLILFSQTEKKRIEIIDTKGSIQSTLNMANPEWDFGPSLPQPGRFAWNNTTNSLAINSPNGLFFFDIKSGKICQLDLGEQSEEKLWPYYASWSPNNRYLAMLTTSGTGILPFMNLTILDYLTGKLIPVIPENSLSTGNFFFTDITWSPDSKTIATLFGRGDNIGNQLLFVDVTTGNSKQVLPETNFYSGGISGNLAWSPDGAHIAYICPKGPLCIGDINR